MFNSRMTERIKKRLITLNITQADLARKLGYTRQHVSAIINGVYESLEIETLILEELGISDTRTISR